MKFKPCPFCGNTTINIIPQYQYDEINQAFDLSAWAECSFCHARSARGFIDSFTEEGFSKSEEERGNPKIVYDLWNRRVNE